MPKAKFPEPIEIPAANIIVNDVNEASLILKKYGVAVIPIPIDKNEMEMAFKETKFYNTANDMFIEEHKVEEPSLFEFNTPSKYKNRKAGDNAQGMIHQYGTPLHTLLQTNTTVRNTMKSLYGGDIKYLPNRLRVCRKFKNNCNTLHIEAHELFEEVDGELRLIPGEIASLVGLTGVRRFVFWDLNDIDLKPLKEYHDKHGSEFTLIDPDYMHKHYPNRRRMVNIDCRNTPHMIIWQESNPHEIASSPSISLYISPVKKFNNTKITKVTSYQPLEYLGLTYHESDMLGLCYNMGGFEWPSGKKLYQFAHHRAYNHYMPKIDKYYKRLHGKFQQKLVRNGKVDQHTPEYKAKLKDMKILLPEIAFDKDTPNFVVDITKIPINILQDYGFVTRELTDEDIAAEALLKLNNNTFKIGGHLH